MRLKKMLSDGLVEETENILKQKYPTDSPGLRSIGYPAVIRYLDKKISYNEMAEQIFLSTRQYAKRQQTWARGHRWPTLNIWNMATEEIIKYILVHSNIII
jgi:tRNA dimethylallyltransferase